MSKVWVIFVVGMALVSSSALHAQAANKSYFAARNELQQTGRSWAMSEPHKMNRARVSRWGVTSEAMLFYTKSTNTQGLGEYFGAAANANRSDANATVKVILDETKDTNALYGRDIDHTYDQTNTEAPMYGTLNLAPWQERTGVVLSTDWDVSKAFKNLKGWHVGITVPVVEVTNNMGLTFTKDGASTTDTNKSDSGTIAQFFGGTYEQSHTENWQKKLTHGLVDTTDRKKSGVADCKINLSYKFDVHRDSAIQLRAGLIVPTGNSSTAVDMFEALYGNNGHVGVSCGGAAMIELTKNRRKGTSWWWSSVAEYTFLFQGREKRLLGLYDAAGGKTAAWGQYALGIEKGKGSVAPLANALVRDVYVTPGSHMDWVSGLTWAWGNLNLNVGYNMFYRQTEGVKLASPWPMDRFGIASLDHDAGNAGIISGIDSAGPVQPEGMTTTKLDGAAVQYQIDPVVCTAADQVTQSLLCAASYHGRFGGIGFWGRVGANYELAAADSKALTQYGLYGSIGLSF